jgi:hypothetical protein
MTRPIDPAAWEKRERHQRSLQCSRAVYARLSECSISNDGWQVGFPSSRARCRGHRRQVIGVIEQPDLMRMRDGLDPEANATPLPREPRRVGAGRAGANHSRSST